MLRYKSLYPSLHKGQCSYEEHPWGLSIHDSFSGLITESVSDILCDKINQLLSHVGMQEDNRTLHCIAYELSPQQVTISSPNQEMNQRINTSFGYLTPAAFTVKPV